MQDITNQEFLELEAAQAVGMMRDSADLEDRIGVLKERISVTNDRLAVFIVTMPEGYDGFDSLVFKKFISSHLEKLANEADEYVKFKRTWRDKL